VTYLKLLCLKVRNIPFYWQKQGININCIDTHMGNIIFVNADINSWYINMDFAFTRTLLLILLENLSLKR
jgi:hypothetical protein